MKTLIFIGFILMLVPVVLNSHLIIGVVGLLLMGLGVFLLPIIENTENGKKQNK